MSGGWRLALLRLLNAEMLWRMKGDLMPWYTEVEEVKLGEPQTGKPRVAIRCTRCEKQWEMHTGAWNSHKAKPKHCPECGFTGDVPRDGVPRVQQWAKAADFVLQLQQTVEIARTIQKNLSVAIEAYPPAESSDTLRAILNTTHEQSEQLTALVENLLTDIAPDASVSS